MRSMYFEQTGLCWCLFHLLFNEDKQWNCGVIQPVSSLAIPHTRAHTHTKLIDIDRQRVCWVVVCVCVMRRCVSSPNSLCFSFSLAPCFCTLTTTLQFHLSPFCFWPLKPTPLTPLHLWQFYVRWTDRQEDNRQSQTDFWQLWVQLLWSSAL